MRVSLKRRSREWRVETILDRSRASCRQISWRRVCLCHGSPARREEHGRREETEASLAAEAAYAATGRTGCAGQVASQFVVNWTRVFPLREWCQFEEESVFPSFDEMTLTGKRLPRIRTLLRFANMRLRKRKKNLEWKGISILRERKFHRFCYLRCKFRYVWKKNRNIGNENSIHLDREDGIEIESFERNFSVSIEIMHRWRFAKFA